MFNRRKLINNHILQWLESLTSKLPLLICKIDENYSQVNIELFSQKNNNIELYKENKTNQSCSTYMIKLQKETC